MGDGRKYYVLCEANCKFESMTKEQIYELVAEAAASGELKGVDTGFVTKIKESNRGTALSFWVGTSAEYNALEEKADECFYILTDDTTGDDLKKAVEDLQKEFASVGKVINKVGEAAAAAVETATAAAAVNAEIIVTVAGGATTSAPICTNADTGEGLEVTIDGDKYIFKTKEYGSYTVLWIVDGHTHSKTVTVDAIKTYSVHIEDYDDVFANNTWEQIINVCKNGNVPATWNVGDSKMVDFKSTRKSVTIIGKYHDRYADTGEVAPLTFIIENLERAKMNDTATNEGGWWFSKMRTETLPLALAQLSEEVAAAIREVEKLTYHTSSVAYNTADKLFLLSETEHYGSELWAKNSEGEQYDFFADGNELVDAEETWTRSLASTTAFCIRDQSKSNESGLISWDKEANEITNCSPCFCF